MATEPNSPRRAYGIALALLVAGGALLLVGYSLTWASADVALLAGSGVRSVPFSGRDLLPVAAVSGWVALAAAAGVVATRSWGRTLVGLIAFVSGMVGLVGAVWFAVARTGLVDAAVSALVADAGGAPSQVGLGWLVAVAGGVLVAIAGAWTIIGGRAWPSMGARYERTTPAGKSVSAWDAQDLGQDPTDDLVE